MFQKSKENNILPQIYDMQQRGGRMLSIIDLIQSGTISVELAAHLTTLIIKGITISSGSLVGGTGKTTLLASLLAFLPQERNLVTVTHSNLNTLLNKSNEFKNTTFLCHEISPAHYYSYLWGKDLKSYFDLKMKSNNLAFTIHADSPDEVYPQIVNDESKLNREDFFKIDVLIFIKTIGDNFQGSRKVTFLFEKDYNTCKHVLTYKYNNNKFIKLNDSPLLDKKLDSYKQKIKNLLENLIRNNIHKIENVRNEFLSLFSQIG